MMYNIYQETIKVTDDDQYLSISWSEQTATVRPITCVALIQLQI